MWKSWLGYCITIDVVLSLVVQDSGTAAALLMCSGGVVLLVLLIVVCAVLSIYRDEIDFSAAQGAPRGGS